MLRKLSTLVLLITLLNFIGAQSIDGDLENKNVERVIDLTSQLVKITYKITLDHKSKKPISNYLYSLPIAECLQLSYISARDSAKKDLKLTTSKSSTECSYSMTLPTASANPVINIEAVFTKALLPFPTAITQAERQLVRYIGSAYFYSPYKTVTQKTTIHLASRSVESFTQVKPSVHSDTQIAYGPYENIARKN